MQRIFITGGTGFFGKSILDYRLRHPDFLADADITILSRNPDAFIAAFPNLANQQGLHFIQGDVRTFQYPNIPSPEHSANFDILIHAATSAVTTISDDEMYSTIVDGTRHVLEFAKTHGVKKLLFTSSGAVYGPQTTSVSEDAPCRPTTAYGKGKLLAERMCIDSGIPAYIARCFAFVGPHLNRRIHYAIGNFIQDCLDNKPIVIKGDGTPLRSYLYADDLVEWLFAILERGQPGRPYNVGSPHGLSIRELAETVRSTLSTHNDVIVQGTHQTLKSCKPETLKPPTYVPITTRVEAELCLTVEIPLVKAIRNSTTS